MVVVKKPEFLDIGFGDDTTYNTVKGVNIVLEVEDFRYEPLVEVLGVGSVKGCRLKKGDRIICSWFEVEDAMRESTDKGYTMIPNSAVIAKYNDGIEPVHGYKIVRGVVLEDKYEVKRGLKQDTGSGYLLDGSPVYFDAVWAFPVQQEPYVTLEEKFYYIHEDKISVWITGRKNSRG